MYIIIQIEKNFTKKTFTNVWFHHFLFLNVLLKRNETLYQLSQKHEWNTETNSPSVC